MGGFGEVKEYKVNEAVLVTNYTLDALYQKYRFSFPKDISNKIIELIRILENNLNNQQNKDYVQCDIKETYYTEKIIFDNNIKH